MTSTMKSEPATPPIRVASLCGVPVSAAIVCAVGGSADGSARGGGAGGAGRVRGLRRDGAGGAGDGHAGQKFAAIDLRAGILRA